MTLFGGSARVAQWQAPLRPALTMSTVPLELNDRLVLPVNVQLNSVSSARSVLLSGKSSVGAPPIHVPALLGPDEPHICSNSLWSTDSITSLAVPPKTGWL